MDYEEIHGIVGSDEPADPIEDVLQAAADKALKEVIALRPDLLDARETEQPLDVAVCVFATLNPHTWDTPESVTPCDHAIEGIGKQPIEGPFVSTAVTQAAPKDAPKSRAIAQMAETFWIASMELQERFGEHVPQKRQLQVLSRRLKNALGLGSVRPPDVPPEKLL